MAPTLNLSAYRFVELTDPGECRERIHAAATARRLKGTVLLATEGINLFLAGAAEDARGFMVWLRDDARFAGLQAKESWSDATPFRKLLVKVKREIIRMDHPSIRPQSGRAPSVDPVTLRRWLDTGRDDDGRPVVMLDTRNDFEVDAGAFGGAIDWRLSKFTDFPGALASHAPQLGSRTVVSYCTGGIRCEKAALLMAARGVERVLQLEGGILKYLELTDGAHFHGHCFVFDERRLVDARLAVAAAPAQA
jgi:UPF0176 protein